MNVVINLLNLFVQLITGVFLFNILGKPKKGFWFTLFIWFSAMSGEFFLFRYLGERAPTMEIQAALRTLTKIMVVLLLYGGTIWNRILPIAGYFFIAIVCEPLSALTTCAVFDISQNDYYVVNGDNVFLSAGKLIAADMLLLSSVLIAIVFSLRKKPGRTFFTDVFVIAGFTVIHLFFLMLYYRVNRNNLTEINNLIQLAFQALLFAMLFIQYYNTLRTRKLLESEQELQMLKTEMDNNYRYYKLADSKFDEISKLRHDIQNQFTTVRQLMCTPEGTEQARNIMDNIQEQLESVRAVNYCGNKTLNAVLTVKLNEERVRGIQTQVILRDCDDLPVDDYDLCSLVTNMFDNAVESCLRTAHPELSFIEIKSGVQKDYFVLKITNSCEDEDIGRSRKGRGHGYGMKIAEEICRKYGGEFRLRKDGDTAVSSAFMRRNS